MRRWVAHECALNDRSLVGFWPLVGNRLDHSGGGRHLACSAAKPPRFVTTLGRTGFTTKDRAEYLIAEASGPLDINALLTAGDVEFSVSCWFVARDPDTFGGLVSQTATNTGTTTDGNWRGWKVYLDAGVVGFAFARDWDDIDFYAHRFATPPGAGLRWTHVVATAKKVGAAYTLGLYFNGRPADGAVSDGNLTTNPGADGEDFLVGAAVENGTGFTDAHLPAVAKPAVVIDLVRVYGRALSGREVAALHRRELGAFYWKPTVAKRVTAAGGVTLYVGSHDASETGTTLFVEGGNTNAGLPLAVEGWGYSADTGLPLVVVGGGATPGVVGGTTLVTVGETGVLAEGMNLYTAAPGQLTRLRNVNLYVGGKYASEAGGVTLFTAGTTLVPCLPVWESWDYEDWDESDDYDWDCLMPGSVPAVGGVTLYTQSVGPVPDGDGVNLYTRVGEGVGVTLYVAGPADGYAAGVPLVVVGARPVTGGVPLVVPVADDSETAPLVLYTHGW